MALESAGRPSDPAGRTLGQAMKALKPTGRPLRPAERPLELQSQLGGLQSWLGGTQNQQRTSEDPAFENIVSCHRARKRCFLMFFNVQFGDYRSISTRFRLGSR